MEDKRSRLKNFVKKMHKDKIRKYTGEPYYNHLISVAQLSISKCHLGYEIGLCHDLLEDTDCTDKVLLNTLITYGYTASAAYHITKCVVELTDVFTTEKYPSLNRSYRKQKEADRLHCISDTAQTVKYADLIDNTASIVEHDKSFAKTYIAEKEVILKGMAEGNQELYKMALNSLKEAKLKLL